MQSMEEIYQEYARIVYRYLLSKTHDEDLAEELTQEIYRRRGHPRMQGSGNVRYRGNGTGKRNLPDFEPKLEK